MKTVVPPNRGYSAKIYINDVLVGGQMNANLNRTAEAIDITNKISGIWQQSIAGVRSWEVNCSGLKIQGDAAFTSLQQAFDAGSKVYIVLSDNNIVYKGYAIITSFPIVANYSDSYTYNIKFKGTGPLEDE